MDNISLLGFVLAAFVVLLIPGPGVLYVVTRTLIQGRRAGLISVLGLSAGALIHVAAATAGLSAILLTSATAFGIVKTLGAFYLIYLGFRTLLARQPTSDITAPKPDSLHRIFADGVMVSILNPKIAVFFLAFLPQFIVPDRGTIPHQFLLLGLLYVALAICTDGAYALFAASVRRLLNRQLMLGALPKYVSGIIYLGLGVSLAFAERKA
jgi:threonine/homoserine/homoserine lactone efflux protein